MTIIVRHSGLRSTHQCDSRIENEILGIRELITIDEAHVRLEKRRDQAPPFRVSVHLVTPGPDIRVESHDHTLAAAILKVSRELRRRITLKAARRVSRSKSNLQLSSFARRVPRPVVGKGANV